MDVQRGYGLFLSFFDHCQQKFVCVDLRSIGPSPGCRDREQQDRQPHDRKPNKLQATTSRRTFHNLNKEAAEHEISRKKQLQETSARKQTQNQSKSRNNSTSPLQLALERIDEGTHVGADWVLEMGVHCQQGRLRAAHPVRRSSARNGNVEGATTLSHISIES